MEEEFFRSLLDNGAMGLFIAYLIFDRQVLLRGVTKALKEITEVLAKLEHKIDHHP